MPWTGAHNCCDEGAGPNGTTASSARVMLWTEPPAGEHCGAWSSPELVAETVPLPVGEEMDRWWGVVPRALSIRPLVSPRWFIDPSRGGGGVDLRWA